MTVARSALWACVAATVFLGACATKVPPHDDSAFNRARPATLLVMPPVNDSTDVNATASVWAQATRPLAEAGYYVLPVTLVDETFRQNGVNTANEAQEIPLPKLRDFFGADAAVYLKVSKYGTRYAVVSSETRVEIEGRIIDLRSGDLLWAGKAFASSAEQQQQSQGGIVGLLVGALVAQIVGTTTDAAYNFAGIADARLLGAPRYNGIPVGPRARGRAASPPAQ